MFLLQLVQSEYTHHIGLFESEQQIHEWLKLIPVYQEDDAYFLDVSQVQDYEEIAYLNARSPLTRHSFDDSESVLVIWTELPVLSQTSGLVEGTTKVDAYVIDNYEVAQYIANREAAVSAIRHYYESLGKKMDRAGSTSEDGEYLLLDGKFLTHLDPMFVESYKNHSIEKFIEQFEQNS